MLEPLEQVEPGHYTPPLSYAKKIESIGFDAPVPASQYSILYPREARTVCSRRSVATGERPQWWVGYARRGALERSANLWANQSGQIERISSTPSWLSPPD